MASTAKQTNNLILNARVTYALSLYCSTVNVLGVRDAYDRACEIAGLTLSDRAQLRAAVTRGAR